MKAYAELVYQLVDEGPIPTAKWVCIIGVVWVRAVLSVPWGMKRHRLRFIQTSTDKFRPNLRTNARSKGKGLTVPGNL